MTEALCGANAAARSNHYRRRVPDGPASAREVNLPSPGDGSRDLERVAGADQKPVPSGGHYRLRVGP